MQSITSIEAALLSTTTLQIRQCFDISEQADDEHLIDQRRLCAAGDFEAVLASLPNPSNALESLTVAAAHILLFVQQNITGCVVVTTPTTLRHLTLTGRSTLHHARTPLSLAWMVRTLRCL